MLERLKKTIIERWNAFVEWISIGKILLLLLGILVGLAMICLFVFLCQKATNFIIANYELLLFCASIVGGVAYYVWCKRENHKSVQAAQLRTQMTIEEEREKQHLEDAYLHIQELLFHVINETAIITKIPQLKSVSALDAPTHFVLANGFYVFQYLVAKDNATTSNLIQMKDVLNNRLRQALNAGEVIGSQPMFFSTSGRPYQKILIHDIQNMGSFLQFNAVIVGEKYASYIERVKVVNSTAPLDNSDLDF